MELLRWFVSVDTATIILILMIIIPLGKKINNLEIEVQNLRNEKDNG